MDREKLEMMIDDKEVDCSLFEEQVDKCKHSLGDYVDIMEGCTNTTIRLRIRRLRTWKAPFGCIDLGLGYTQGVYSMYLQLYRGENSAILIFFRNCFAHKVVSIVNILVARIYRLIMLGFDFFLVVNENF